MSLTFSEVESRRFGLHVFRYRADGLDVDVLEGLIASVQADLTICRVPARELHRLSGMHLPVIVADVLVHYARAVEGRVARIRRDLDFDPCGEKDAAELAAVVRSVFAGYVSHYAANPLLDPSLILEGQVEWALSCIDGGRAFLVRREGKAVGFFTHRYEAESVEIVLGGAVPESRGAGVYRDGIRHGINVAAERGCSKVLCSTQVWNTAVQRAWQFDGFLLGEPEVTFHVMRVKP